MHKSEFTLSPNQRFFYLVLSNQHFWDTYQQLGLPALPFPPSPPTFQTPILSEIIQGPLPASNYNAMKHNIEALMMDENCEKVLGHILHKEEKKGVDMSVLFDPSAFDESHLEAALESMSID